MPVRTLASTLFRTGVPGHGFAADAGLLIARLAGGTAFMFHGSQKLFSAFGGMGIEGFTGYLTSLNVPVPAVNAWVAAGTEFFGGLALLLGLGTRIVGVPLLFTMLVAFALAHKGSWAEGELSAVLGLLTLALTLQGAGRFSIDHLMAKRLNKG